MLKKYQYQIALGALICVYACPTYAIGKRDVPLNLAENGVNLNVSRGYGIILNLASANQTIATAWLSDPSQLTIASNKGPCNGQECAGSSILYIKPIERINFPGLPSSADGGSLLSITTSNGQIFQFRLMVSNSTPNYTNVALVPNIDPVPPSFAQPSPPLRSVVPPQQIFPASLPPAPPSQDLNSKNFSGVPPAMPEIIVSIPEEPEETRGRNDEVVEDELDGDTKSGNHQQPDEEIVDENLEKDETDVTEDEGDSSHHESNQEEKINSPLPLPEIIVDTSDKADDTINTEDKEEEPDGQSESDENTVTPNSIALSSKNSPTPKTNQEMAGALLRGLHSNEGVKQAPYGSLSYRRVQDVIYLLKRDTTTTLEQATARARFDQAIAESLIQFGTKSKD